MTDRDINDCCKELQAIIPAWKSRCAAAGISVKPIVTYRDDADQEKAKEECLSKAGPGQSPHNCVDADGNPASKAFDFGVFEEDGTYVTDGTDPRYAKAGYIAKQLGLEWGGDWTIEKDGCNPDFDHLQLANWKSQA